jgi:hypothetical protein
MTVDNLTLALMQVRNAAKGPEQVVFADGTPVQRLRFDADKKILIIEGAQNVDNRG